VVNPDKLRAIRSAYQLTTRGETTDPVGYALLNSFLGPDYMPLIQVGWYGVGCKRDVPACACYVAHCGDRYVWVTSDGLDGLSRMTLVVLNVATLDSNAAAIVPSSVSANSESSESANGKKLQLLPAPDTVYEVLPRARENYFNPLQSQIQMAR